MILSAILEILQNLEMRKNWEKKGSERAVFYDGDAIAVRYESLFKSLIRDRIVTGG